MSGWAFWMGVICGVCGTFFIALLVDVDTIGTAAQRGFTIWDDTLYVIRPATPTEANSIS